MVVLIVLNIILIISLISFILYYFIKRNNKNVYEDNICDKHEIKINKDHKKINYDRVFDGRFITDDEYNEMMKNKKSGTSILLEELNREYEHLKELNK